MAYFPHRTKANIGNVEDVELTQLGTFTGELGKAIIEGISDVSFLCISYHAELSTLYLNII